MLLTTHKICTGCGLLLPPEDFGKLKKGINGKQPRCKVCKREYDRNRYRDNDKVQIYYRIKAIMRQKKSRDIWDKYKVEVGCIICGYNKCSSALEFHHRDPDQKNFGIANAITKIMDYELIAVEVKKCDVICANCHRELHFDEYKEIYENLGPKSDRGLSFLDFPLKSI